MIFTSSTDQSNFSNLYTESTIEFFISEFKEYFSCSIEYCTKLFKRNTIEKFIEHFKKILVTVTSNPQITISDIEAMSDIERGQILYNLNNTRREYVSNKKVLELFEDQVKRTPGHAALKFENQVLTYLELEKKANQLAIVISYRAGKSGIVGIIEMKSMDMIIGILGILKSNRAFLPISEDIPGNRMKYFIKDSGMKLLLTHSKWINKFQNICDTMDLKQKHSIY